MDALEYRVELLRDRIDLLESDLKELRTKERFRSEAAVRRSMRAMWCAVVVYAVGMPAAAVFLHG